MTASLHNDQLRPAFPSHASLCSLCKHMHTSSTHTPAGLGTIAALLHLLHLQHKLAEWCNLAPTKLSPKCVAKLLHPTTPLQTISDEAANDIDKDLKRTFPNTKRFKAEEGQASLRKVLRAYAAYDPEVSYCQVSVMTRLQTLSLCSVQASDFIVVSLSMI